MGFKWKALGLLIVGMGLLIQSGHAQNESRFLPRYLEMLGYSATEIEQLLSGATRLTALDEAYQLEAMGYAPEEIEQILTGKQSRRQVDSAYGQKTLAAATGETLLSGAAPDEDTGGASNQFNSQSPLPESLSGAKDPMQSYWDGLQYGHLERTQNRARPYLGTVRTTAQRFQIDPALILAVISAESDFQPRAVSPKGALGLMQLMPHTGEIFGASIGDLFDPGHNIQAGTQFLAECLARFDDERLALAAYNAGPSRVARHQAVPPIRETRRYVAKVLRLRQEYRALLGPDSDEL